MKLNADWIGAIGVLLWLGAIVAGVWLSLMWLDRKIKRGQREREAKACAQAQLAIERWRSKQQDNKESGVGESKTP